MRGAMPSRWEVCAELEQARATARQSTSSDFVVEGNHSSRRKYKQRGLVQWVNNSLSALHSHKSAIADLQMAERKED
jgi:hypothetical protein